MTEGHDARVAEIEMPALVSGKLCLDFVNTVEPRGGPAHPVSRSHDYLTSYEALVVWGSTAHVLARDDARMLLAAAAMRREDARATFEHALAVREAIYRVFWQIASGAQPSRDDVRLLAREHQTTMSHAELVATRGGFEWVTAPIEADAREVALDRVLWPVIRSATDLLTREDLGRVKVCPGVPGDPVGCAWLFYDTSKNRIRQWCSMEDCGSGAKARRQTERRRAARKQQHTATQR
jgi:predicted RNA-binding Zn ribbon-like protein